MKNYMVSYKNIENNFALSFYKIKGINEENAIEAAKDLFVKDWYEGELEGKKILNKLHFYISH